MKGNCEHNDFEANVDVHKVYEDGSEGILCYIAEISIKCKECNKNFKFKGLPKGLNFNGSTVSASGYEARLALK